MRAKGVQVLSSMADIRSIINKYKERVRRAVESWWGGIGCRISFFMSLALFFVSAMIGLFFLWEARDAVDTEVRGRATYVGRYFSALMIDDIITEDSYEMYKKLVPAFLSHDDTPASGDLVYLMVYNRKGALIIGKTPDGMIVHRNSGPYTQGSFAARSSDAAELDADVRNLMEPFFQKKENGLYEITMPVIISNDRVGFLRIGISNQWRAEKFIGFVKKALLALLGIFALGLFFSQLIAAGIIRPISQLSAAVDELGKQNWKAPLPVTGRDEISKLGHAFNHMAHTLKLRETSLSQGNRDLFILHTAGLDLMEGLDRKALLEKITARTEDLVRADTTAIVVVDAKDRMLKYLGVSGSKARQLNDLDMPLESGGIYNWLVSYGTPLLIADAQADFRLDVDDMKLLGVKCLMTVPLWSSNRMAGLLTVINKKGGANFDKHDLRIFTVFSNLASAALQNSSLYTDLKDKMKELGSAQEQLIHSTKMAAIGEIAANIAHEINNPLTSVLGYTSHLLKTLELPESSQRMLRMMEQETLRVRKIIRNLLDFSRQKPSWIRPSDLMLPVKETVALLQGAADASSVHIIEEYPATPVMVNMDHNEMKQVFINIVTNALQAMPQGGKLRICIDNTRDHDAVVEFIDTGVGIPQEHAGRIFEPFFSTKEDGDGTGLGLSISYRIVQNHGGTVEVESQVNKGTTFRVVLPLHQAADVVRK